MKKLLYLPFSPAEQLVFFYRVYSFCYKFKVLLPLAYLLYYIVRLIFSSDIHPKAKIGKRFSIRHHFGIVIGKNVEIGDDVIVYNGVSIGQLNVIDSAMPVIGNRVIIYKGAVVVGGIELQDDSIVGANKLLKPEA